jgi:cytoskeletal protein CcmA (bactofilin family)
MSLWTGEDRPADKPEESFTVLGRSVALNGILCFSGTVRIDGRLEGEIHTKGDLEVGTGGVLKGTISAGTLVNGGKIRGNVTADRVRLLPSSVLIGEVETPLLSIEEGARFQGLSNPNAADRFSSRGGAQTLLEPPPGYPTAPRLIATSLPQGATDPTRGHAQWKSQ